MQISTELSGIVINQNGQGLPEDSDDLVFPSNGYYQTFVLPPDYVRGVEDIPETPDLTGFQLKVAIPSGMQDQASITWSLDVFTNAAWLALSSGTTIGTGTDEETWFSVYFDTPIPILPSWLAKTFRIKIFSATFVSALYYTVPNPLTGTQVFYNNDTPFVDPTKSSPASIQFRILAAVADTGTDSFGNVVRTAVVGESPDNVVPDSSGYWLSHARPSAFAVENLYFDLREGNAPVVIDYLTLDPAVTGVSFHVYYSVDPSGPGTDAESWDELLWVPVYKTFQALRIDTYALPYPILASYVKIEFTMLQPQPYNPGPHQLPVIYNKHPQWVLTFFIQQFSNEELDLISSGVTINYDALNLAFTYYKADITQDPDPPALAAPLTTQPFQTNAASQVDPITLNQVRLNFQPFLTQPAFQGTTDVTGSTLSSVASGNAAVTYSVEEIVPALGDTSVVSNLNREALLVEKGFPSMYFYIPCRHAYRQVQATFEQNIGYFAGVNSIAFHREDYGVVSDQSLYIELLGDGQNAAISDPPNQ